MCELRSVALQSTGRYPGYVGPVTINVRRYVVIFAIQDAQARRGLTLDRELIMYRGVWPSPVVSMHIHIQDTCVHSTLGCTTSICRCIALVCRFADLMSAVRVPRCATLFV